MAKEICISSTPHETRLAIIEDDQVTEIYYERENEYTLAGSIYKGKVTRVLPGMQSAFVDIGLERDAFLYVTDFLDMEDHDDGEGVDPVPAAAPAPAPRREGGQKEKGRRGRQGRERSAPEAAVPVEEADAEPVAPIAIAPEEAIVGEDGEQGTRRWRGRRGRRRGRGQAGEAEPVVEAGATSDSYEPSWNEGGALTIDIEAVAAPVAAASAGSSVLPGESLARYGGKPAPEAQTTTKAAKPAPANSLKPSTIVDGPIEWDGSSLLPGETIRRRKPAPVDSEDAQPAKHAESVEAIPVVEPAETDTVEVAVVESPEPTEIETQEHASEADAEASHKVDPSAPAEFRFFSREPKKPEREEVEPAVVEPVTYLSAEPAESVLDEETDEPALPPADEEELVVEEKIAYKATSEIHTHHASAGVMEEEEIDDEEAADGFPIHAQADDTDDEDLEEETLDQQLSSGAAGELLHEAHLDDRIERTFERSGDEEDLEEDEFPPEFAGSPDQPEEAEAEGGEPARRKGNRRGRGRNGRMSRQTAQTSDLPIISDLLKPGQQILVQIAKEPIAKKGARITSHIALPGRFLVFMPTVNHVGVSRKISSDEERQRLRRILTSEKGEASGGFIVRTAAAGATEEELRADLRFLINLWNEIKQRSDEAKPPALIYHDLNLVERILRDQVSDTFSTIWVDTENDYERIVRFLNRFSPSLVRRVKLYTKETPLFEQFGIQDEITKALKSKVWLKSGGSIVINQTEALVAIDINTGKYVGKTARLEDTILKTNLDAIPEIVRQIRLRDLGGIIVIDFIDMDERRNRYKVMQALEEALKADRAPSKVLQFNDFGLVAITRKRVKQSLERTLSTQCMVCSGTGMTKSPTTVCNEIYVEMRKMRKSFDQGDVLLRVHPEVVKTLKSNNGRWLNDLEEIIGRNVIVKSDASLHPEQFDVQ